MFYSFIWFVFQLFDFSLAYCSCFPCYSLLVFISNEINLSMLSWKYVLTNLKSAFIISYYLIKCYSLKFNICTVDNLIYLKLVLVLNWWDIDVG